MKYSLRSRLRFSLRDMFWLTVVVALAVGWWVDRSRLHALWTSAELDYSNSDQQVIDLTEYIQEVQAEIQRLGIADSRGKGGKVVLRPPDSSPPPTSQAPAPNPPKD